MNLPSSGSVYRPPPFLGGFQREGNDVIWDLSFSSKTPAPGDVAWRAPNSADSPACTDFDGILPVLPLVLSIIEVCMRLPLRLEFPPAPAFLVVFRLPKRVLFFSPPFSFLARIDVVYPPLSSTLLIHKQPRFYHRFAPPADHGVVGSFPPIENVMRQFLLMDFSTFFSSATKKIFILSFFGPILVPRPPSSLPPVLARRPDVNLLEVCSPSLKVLPSPTVHRFLFFVFPGCTPNPPPPKKVLALLPAGVCFLRSLVCVRPPRAVIVINRRAENYQFLLRVPGKSLEEAFFKPNLR